MIKAKKDALPSKEKKEPSPEELEKQIENLESSLLKLAKSLETETDLEKLQLLFDKKEGLEVQREVLYERLDAVL